VREHVTIKPGHAGIVSRVAEEVIAKPSAEGLERENAFVLPEQI
jgi:hypothetical protein